MGATDRARHLGDRGVGCLGRSGVTSDPKRDPAGGDARRTVALTGAIVAALG